MQARARQFLKRVPGIGAALALAIPAWIFGSLVPIVGAPIFAIVGGMALSFLKRPPALEDGIAFTGKKILQYSIVFLGFGLDLGVVAKVGAESLGVMVFTLAAAFITAYALGKALRLDSKITILIGVGTAICGGSAIAATAPVIKANEEEVAYSISTIFLFNIIAVFLFPFIGHLAGMSQQSFGLWAGTAINDTSSVVAAGFSFGDAAGRYATVVKLTRTLMIIPVTLTLAFLQWKKGAKAQGTLDMKKIVPWFVFAFLGASIVRSLAILPTAASTVLPEVGKFGICVAMAAIGLRSNPVKLIKNGIKPILLGLACWFAVASVALLVQGMAA